MGNGSGVRQPVSYGQSVRDLAAERGAARAVTFVSAGGMRETISWAELDRRSEAVAHELSMRGIAQRDRVGLSAPNSPGLVLAIIAVWKCGAVPVPIRWDLPEWERSRLFRVLGARMVLDASAINDLARNAPDAIQPLRDVVPQHAWGICSSGTTGTPKIIVITRPGLIDPATSVPLAALWSHVETPQVILVPAPLYHTAGFDRVVDLVGGDAIVLMERFNPRMLLDVIEEERVTVFSATPTMLQRVARLDGVGDRDFSSLRWVVHGGAVIPPFLAERWFDLVGPTRFILVYGMSERLGLCAMRGDEWPGHIGSVGRPIFDTEVKVITMDGGMAVPGEIGEIHLRSATSQQFTYLGADLPRQTTEGFVTVGDLGWMDESGYLYVVDRRVDLIITGGANVYPAEVEAALIEHPGVADVVVIGLPDSEWGRRVHAIVEPSSPPAPGARQDLIAWARARLAAYKVPKTIEFVARLPRSAATKISRSALIAEREAME